MLNAKQSEGLRSPEAIDSAKALCECTERSTGESVRRLDRFSIAVQAYQHPRQINRRHSCLTACGLLADSMAYI
jgi:hypothetical protein